MQFGMNYSWGILEVKEICDGIRCGTVNSVLLCRDACLYVKYCEVKREGELPKPAYQKAANLQIYHTTG